MITTAYFCTPTRLFSKPMKKENFVLILAVVLFGFVFYRQIFQNDEEVAFYEESGKPVLNEDFFQKHVREPYGEKISSLANLVVFLDAERVCNAHLREGPNWVTPLSSYDVAFYSLLIFIPDDMPKEAIEAFLGYLGISNDYVIAYKRTSPIASLNPSGVTKYFFSMERGIHWFEFGSTDKKGQRLQKERLEKSIKEVLEGY